MGTVFLLIIISLMAIAAIMAVFIGYESDKIRNELWELEKDVVILEMILRNAHSSIDERDRIISSLSLDLRRQTEANKQI